MNPFILILFLLCLVGCSDFKEELPENKIGIYSELPIFYWDEGPTRSSLTPTENGIKFFWSQGDEIGIVPKDDYTQQTNFAIVEGAGTREAKFDGGAWKLKDNCSYLAYYPYKSIIAHSNDKLELDYTKQVQKTNNSTDHLGEVYYCYCDAVLPNNGYTNFKFKALSSIIKLTIQINKTDVFNKLELSLGEELFVQKSLLDLSDGYLESREKSKTFSLALNDIQVELGQDIVLWMMLPSTDKLIDKTINVCLVGSTHKEVGTITGRIFEAGKAYRFSISSQNFDSKIKTDQLVDMFVPELQGATFANSFTRTVIGTDNEGWVYVTQRRTVNNLPNHPLVKIIRTKDFVTYEDYKTASCGVQLIQLSNGELCLATIERDNYDNEDGYYCNIYVTTGGKTGFEKKFHTTHTSYTNNGEPWSWGIQNRGNVVAISEYGKHGTLGSVWYSRDCGENFYHVFEHSMYAPDYPHAHIHGICVDPYFDRLYVITGDGAPSSIPELRHHNSRLYYWDYNNEVFSNNLYQTIDWKYVNVGLDISLGENLQFVNGYALPNSVVLGSDCNMGAIFKIARGSKEDIPQVSLGVNVGPSVYSTTYCAGNMFKRDEASPLFICVHREYSQDLDEDDPNNPSHIPNTYQKVVSKIYCTFDGNNFEEVWADDTYGLYTVYESSNLSLPKTRYLAKCGRDMSIYHLPDNRLLIKYIGRNFSYVGYNNNGVTAQKSAYFNFNNHLVIGHLE